MPTELDVSARTFYFQGREIIIDESYDYYNSIRLIFSREAQKAAQNFERKYNSYGNIDTAVDHIYEDGIDIAIDVIRRVVINDFFNTLHINDNIDVQGFCEKFYEKNFSDLTSKLEEVSDKYMAIVLNQQQLDEYRTQRRLNRARWVGGGFGFSGAIKGAMKAGALNMASGALHGIFNVGAKALSMVGDAMKKSSLYSKSKKNLTAEIYDFVFNLHYVIWKLDTRYKGRHYVACLYHDFIESAKATVNKFSTMGQDEVFQILPKVLLQNPYDENIYKKLISLFGDPKGELEKIAQYFGVDTSFFAEEKEKLAKKLFYNVKNDLEKSEDYALEAKKKFLSALSSTGLSDTEEAKKFLSIINNKLSDYDRQARTVNFLEKAVVLNSRKDAQNLKATPELKELEKEYNTYTHIGEKTKRPPSGGIEKIDALLKKMPDKIQGICIEGLKKFANEQKESFKESTLRINPIIILLNVVAIVGFIASLPYWDGWNWWGLKGVVTAWPFIILVCLSDKYFEDSDNDENLTNNIYTSLPLFYYSGMFLTLMLPSWNEYSWVGWKSVIVFAGVLAFAAIYTFIKALQNGRRLPNLAKSYLSELEKFFNNYEIYLGKNASSKVDNVNSQEKQLSVKEAKTLSDEPEDDDENDDNDEDYVIDEVFDPLLGGKDNIVFCDFKSSDEDDDIDEDTAIIFVNDFDKIDKDSLFNTAREERLEVSELSRDGHRILKLHNPELKRGILILPKDAKPDNDDDYVFDEALDTLLGGRDNIVDYDKIEDVDDADFAFAVVVNDFDKISKDSLDIARENGVEIAEFLKNGHRTLETYDPESKIFMLILPKDAIKKH